MQEKQLIERQFLEQYTRRGFRILEEVPIYPSPDPTVYFVGAQINQWKALLDDIGGGFANPQNCLRLQNANIFFNNDRMRFCSYFRTEGAIGPADSFQYMLNSAQEFLAAIGVSPSRIVVKTNLKLLGQLSAIGGNFLTCTEPDTYYEWAYGEEDLRGEGVTLAVINAHTGRPYDIGNVIQIYRNDEPLAVEWGFGIETLMAAIHSKDCPIHYANIPNRCQKMLQKSSNYKMLDAISTIVEIVKVGILPGNSGVNKMLSDYCCGYAFHGISNKLSYAEIKEIAQDFLRHGAISPASAKHTIEDIEWHIGRINYFRGLDEYQARIAQRFVSVNKQLAAKLFLERNSDKND